MRNFIERTLSYTLIASVIIVCLHFVVGRFLNNNEAEGSLYIWGDSQTYQGLELQTLEKSSGMNIHSAAIHGSGVYDFLVFCDHVPDRANVIITFSKPSQVRVKSSDNNGTGFSLIGLNSLFRHNYTFKEIRKVINRNRKPKKLFSNKSEMYPVRDSIKLNKPLRIYRDIYSQMPPSIRDKQEIILDGMKILKEKNCKMTIVEFPYHKILRDIEEPSVIRPVIDSFRTSFIQALDEVVQDTLVLDAEKPVMYDLTHLNLNGAQQVARHLGPMLRAGAYKSESESTQTHFITILNDD